ncbi:heterokaryon incompatibility protein-domain-containing protein [Cercophora newfieldiana]|uniref:Heterokaryon incompatibility protein-domain-containing protein n=1 Tax=Cercophora newfieldiana TaxID=92897 RepID=A0AA39XSE4_9PEZI|nr:heterokaryon incompatibility protein-domain-containing protein [Cercophora newfieldiana]
MWLIDVKTLKLVEFVRRPPPYAALSHTWGKEEVGFDEFRRARHIQFWSRFRKIRATCQQARKDGLDYAWIDTCCIDKSNNSELSEAINSMFAWYRQAEVCYAQLEDVPTVLPGDFSRPFSPFGRSRWFRRGWTLQELIAPRRVEFYDARWRMIGEKHDLADELEAITGIGSDTLRDKTSMHLISLGRRMSWATDRETTRPEDLAYSLLGIFDVQMPLIYGEGAEKSFLRLQHHILEQDGDDDTLFAWRSRGVQALSIQLALGNNWHKSRSKSSHLSRPSVWLRDCVDPCCWQRA